MLWTCVMMILFFFSSRRRHTRFDCDWSSDVSLPISAAYGAVNQIMGYAQFTAISISISVSILGAQAIGAGQAGRLDRSEERRVGKECRSRWSLYHSKKKT